MYQIKQMENGWIVSYKDEDLTYPYAVQKGFYVFENIDTLLQHLKDQLSVKPQKK
jgi:hypothetical protein